MTEDKEYLELEGYIDRKTRVIYQKNEAIVILQKLIRCYLTDCDCLHFCVLDKADDKERVLEDLKRFLELPQDLMIFESSASFSDYWNRNKLGKDGKKSVVFISPDAGDNETGEFLNSLGLVENQDYYNVHKLISALS